jgi:hypothetical protein
MASKLGNFGAVETVELDDSAADAIADRVISKAFNAGGYMPKPGERSSISGGLEARYASAGSTDAELAANLHLADTILRGNGLAQVNGATVTINPEDRPTGLSERGREVMLAAGEAALKSGGRPVAEYESVGGIVKHTDPQGYVGKSYSAYRAEARAKALTSTTAGSGSEWVPTFATSELWRDMHLAATVVPQFRRVDMPTNPYTLPTETADLTFLWAGTQNVAVTPSTPTTNKATLTAAKLQAEVDFSGEVTEDSIVPIIPNLRFDLVRRGGQTMDDLAVNGDTTTAASGNVNLDDAAPSANTFYLSMDGIRKFHNVTNTGQETNMGAAPSTTTINSVRKNLGKYGARPSDLILICGVSTYYAALTDTNVLTLEKYGPNATIITGELARWFNIPVLLNETTDKAKSNGRVSQTAGNNTLGWLSLVNTTMWRVGFRRDLQIESFRDIQKDQNILVASFRMAVSPSGISTLHTAGSRNVTV